MFYSSRLGKRPFLRDNERVIKKEKCWIHRPGCLLISGTCTDQLYHQQGDQVYQDRMSLKIRNIEETQNYNFPISPCLMEPYVMSWLSGIFKSGYTLSRYHWKGLHCRFRFNSMRLSILKRSFRIRHYSEPIYLPNATFLANGTAA